MEMLSRLTIVRTFPRASVRFTGVDVKTQRWRHPNPAPLSVLRECALCLSTTVLLVDAKTLKTPVRPSRKRTHLGAICFQHVTRPQDRVCELLRSRLVCRVDLRVSQSEELQYHDCLRTDPTRNEHWRSDIGAVICCLVSRNSQHLPNRARCLGRHDMHGDLETLASDDARRINDTANVPHLQHVALLSQLATEMSSRDSPFLSCFLMSGNISSRKFKKISSISHIKSPQHNDLPEPALSAQPKRKSALPSPLFVRVRPAGDPVDGDPGATLLVVPP